jgi:hypothetical protein
MYVHTCSLAKQLTPAKHCMYCPCHTSQLAMTDDSKESHTICESFMARGNDDPDSCRRRRDRWLHLEEWIVMHQILTCGYWSTTVNISRLGSFLFTLLSFWYVPLENTVIEITSFANSVCSDIIYTRFCDTLFQSLRHSCSFKNPVKS